MKLEVVITASRNASLASVEVQGRTYPAVTRGNCRTCQSEHRLSVERDLVTGRSYTSVASALPPEAGLSARNIADHFRNGHLPVDSPGVQEHARHEARERGGVAEAQIGIIVDHVSMARLVVQRVQERLTSGDLVPSARDGLLAARLLMEVEPPEPQASSTEWTAAMVRYFEAARMAMEADQWRNFLQRLREDPILASLRPN